MSEMVNPKRVRIIRDGKHQAGPALYWMSRERRVADNWALLYAQKTAIEHKQPLAVVFCLVPEFLDASLRQYSFMLKGLEEVEKALRAKNIPFYLLEGDPQKVISGFIQDNKIAVLTTDFDPLRIKREWKKKVASRISIPFYEVDAHNIVPCCLASTKKEYAAYTMRPKIHRMLPEFLEPFPSLKRHPFTWPEDVSMIDSQKVKENLNVSRDVSEVDWIKPGEKAGIKMLNRFIDERLDIYAEQRNDPNRDAQSNLSPYLHFGQLSAQRAALEVRDSPADGEAKDAFLEELIVRRELADNFCLYEPAYDKVEGFPDWAQKTLKDHRMEPRPYLYSPGEFEDGETHDELWNAAQRQMVEKGKMHGYLRMYWAKKILEWSESPEEAMRIAIYLNDKYELDGRDPNGYAGIAWSIGGVHDRAWGQRPVFGKVRYMSYNGAKSKFNVDQYVARFTGERK